MDENVHRAEFAHGLGDDAIAFLLAADVRGAQLATVPPASRTRRAVSSPCFEVRVAIITFAPSLAKTERDAAPDALAAPGDDRDLACQPAVLHVTATSWLRLDCAHTGGRMSARLRKKSTRPSQMTGARLPSPMTIAASPGPKARPHICAATAYTTTRPRRSNLRHCAEQYRLREIPGEVVDGHGDCIHQRAEVTHQWIEHDGAADDARPMSASA